MRVLHINSNDSTGGAAIAAMRLHKVMLEAGIESTFFCLNRTINDNEHIVTIDRKTKLKVRTIDLIQQLFFKKLMLSNTKGLFSNMYFGYRIGKFINLNEYDVIYVHWINRGFLSFKGLEELCKTGKKVFWFMHDMFPITGGCHHSFSCLLYRQNCCNGTCQYLKNNIISRMFAYKQCKKKKKILAKYNNISFIAPSKWLYDCAKASPLSNVHKVYYIPNLLNPVDFKKQDKSFCRNVLNLPREKKLILFGADSALINPYKGFDFLVKALDILSSKEKYQDVELIIFGSSRNKVIEESIKYPCHFFGYLYDKYSLNLLYNAADVFCMPSLAEAFGQTALESVFCGTPVVAFNVGGLPDFISEQTGYLANYKDFEDFERGLEICFNKTDIQNDKVINMCTDKNILKSHIEIWK